ncbi:uncharacterized protein LOC124888155 isoform X1 [Capsicum annuum]|uniref:uncharacterized protein LOC124888155 isoform X1 n=1 Tax=Capsicum annuum TaxID=4072 RepID=UPI001FB15BE0|nr:uncharacterized protein LOC124888155 isoform X1 [Capsicum annuum]
MPRPGPHAFFLLHSTNNIHQDIEKSSGFPPLPSSASSLLYSISVSINTAIDYPSLLFKKTKSQCSAISGRNGEMEYPSVSRGSCRRFDNYQGSNRRVQASSPPIHHFSLISVEKLAILLKAGGLQTEGDHCRQSGGVLIWVGFDFNLDWIWNLF